MLVLASYLDIYRLLLITRYLFEAELLIHEERVERHCAGIEEIIENMKKNFVTMQEKLVEMGERNKIQLHNLEMAFINANKSIKCGKF